MRFGAKALNAAGSQVKNLAVRWAVSAEGAMVESDGGFVAKRPGSYIVTGAIGNQTAVASVVVIPRNIERDIELVGRVKLKENRRRNNG